eukprot:80684_1
MSFNSNVNLNSTLDSVDSNFAGSPADSTTNSQQIFVTRTGIRNQHLTLSQMRGARQIFNHYFPKIPGKRMNKDEKNRRWVSYKNKIYQEYGRVITGKFASERGLYIT